MKNLKKKLIGLGCLILLAGGLVACSSEENISKDEPSDTVEVNSNNGVSNESVSNEFDKTEIKLNVEKVISDDVKGNSYTVDILTPTSGEGFIVSIQVDNTKFTDEDECKSFTRDLITKINNIEGIYSVEISFVANYKINYMVRIEDWNENKNKENLIETLDFRF